MELLRFLHPSLIDQHEAIETFSENSIVYCEEDSYFLIVPVTDDICALYRWNNYEKSDKCQHLSIVQQQKENASLLYREYVRLLVDSIPRSCVESVYVIYHQYKVDVDFKESNCCEFNDNELVKLYYDSVNMCWFVKIYDKAYAISNKNAALRIQEIIYNDCKAIIERRWH